MILTTEQIRAITLGADHVAEENEGVTFHRFTAEQEAFYKERNVDFYKKAFAPASVQLRFRTDSRTVSLDVLTEAGSSRSYFSVDVFVNGEKRGTLNNFEDVTLPELYTNAEFPLGEFKKELDLGDGEKEVCVYLPWSVKLYLRALRLDDGATVQPVKPKKTLLAFGDSITQGYDALYPSNMYITRFSEYLDAELFNKAIGGEQFVPPLPLFKERFVPDYITVAYGTNDWNLCTRECFIENCAGFFGNLRASYPASKIVAITPIWRRDGAEDRAFGNFADLDRVIRDCAASCDGVTVITGYEFVPQDEKLFADLRLHPNDEGFAHYFESFVKAWDV